MTITRYANYGPNGMKPDEDGRWVDYDDYLALANKLDDLINATDDAEQTITTALKRAIKETK